MARLSRTILLGVLAGAAMALGLFITGAVAARCVYGPQMVPEGKFTADQIHAGYFLWTKLLIGMFFGVLLSVLYERLPVTRRIARARQGLQYALLLWLVVYLWGFSHPFVYDLHWSMNRDQVFWLVYTLGGFAGLGLAFGALRTRLLGPSAGPSAGVVDERMGDSRGRLRGRSIREWQAENRVTPPDRRLHPMDAGGAVSTGG